MKTIVAIYFSRYHHSDILAQALYDGARDEGVEVVLIPVAEAPSKLNVIESADAIVFGTPTYFGSMAGEMKAFFDSTSEIWQNKKWHNKIAAAFTHSGMPSGDKLNTLMQLMIFAMQHGMIWVGLDLLGNEERIIKNGTKMQLNRLGSWLGAMSQSDPGEAKPKESDIETVRHLGRRVAVITKSIDLKAKI